jgi:hypothetical protein
MKKRTIKELKNNWHPISRTYSLDDLSEIHKDYYKVFKKSGYNKFVSIGWKATVDGDVYGHYTIIPQKFKKELWTIHK